MKALLFTLCLLAVASAFGCTWTQGPLAPVREVNDASLPTKVLIAARTSDFKNDLLDDLLKRITSDTTYIIVVPLDQLRPDHAEIYAAVVIIDRVWAWRPSRTTRAFLKACKGKANIVLALTATDPDTPCARYGIDAVTSASPKGRPALVAKEIAAAVRRIVEQK